jgi:hypothetical protein
MNVGSQSASQCRVAIVPDFVAVPGIGKAAEAKYQVIDEEDLAMGPRGVGSVQRVGNLDAQKQNQLDFYRTPRNTMLQSQPVKILHGDERFAVLVFNFVERADVRMIQCRGSLGFALEAAENLKVLRDIGWQEL